MLTGGKALFSICQRYNFESKSQQPQKWVLTQLSCFRYVKDTILKANHNKKARCAFTGIAVFDMSKIQF